MQTPQEIQVGEIDIKVLVSSELIESFDSVVKVAGAGPGPHYHTRMDEIFYILSGTVLITSDKNEIKATAGTVVRIPKMTPHAWKSSGGPAHLLVTFIPGGNQVAYLTELGELMRSGGSWRDGIKALQQKYDNTPL
jgi:mannose-6-phosphate isomerase-like protein (cupin superfamily)